MQFEIVRRDVVYPRHSIITDQEPVLDDAGQPVTTLVPFRDESGEPIIDTEPMLDEAGQPVFYLSVIKNADGMPLLDDHEQPVMNSVPVYRKVPRMQAIPVMRKLWDTVENTDAPPDGLHFYVTTWADDSDKQHGTQVDFTIGRAAFEGLNPDEKQALIAREVEIYATAIGSTHPVSSASKSWMEGI